MHKWNASTAKTPGERVTCGDLATVGGGRKNGAGRGSDPGSCGASAQKQRTSISMALSAQK